MYNENKNKNIRNDENLSGGSHEIFGKSSE